MRSEEPVTLVPGLSLSWTRPEAAKSVMAVPTMGISAVAPAAAWAAGVAMAKIRSTPSVHELARDGLAGGLVVLGVLLVDGDGEAGGVDGLDEALVGGVQGSVLGQLDHADLVGLLAGRGVGAVAGAAAGKDCGGRSDAGAGKEVPSGDVHGLLPLLGMK